MNVKKGDIIKTHTSDRTMVLKVNENDALLFTGSQFIIANNIKPDPNNSDVIIWDQGKYYSDIFDVPNFEDASDDYFYIFYQGDVRDVDTLTEGLLLADEMANQQGGDINICLGEETIAFREWFTFDDEDELSRQDEFYDAEENPIIFEDRGFYSDWVMNSDWERFLDLQNNLLCQTDEIDCEMDR